jgi:hypothetical protein
MDFLEEERRREEFPKAVEDGWMSPSALVISSNASDRTLDFNATECRYTRRS